MNLFHPVSTIMTPDPITISPNNPISKVESIFLNHKIHHIPVVSNNKLVGLVSKADYLLFKHDTNDHDEQKNEEIRMDRHLVEEIMTTGIAKLEPTAKISIALAIFKENIFHSIPIVDQDRLVGIVTTYDIISKLMTDNEAHIGYTD